MIGSLGWERERAAAGDPLAAWALAASPAAAAWLAGAAERPERDALPAPAILRRYAVDHGRVSARVALEDRPPFVEGFARSVSDEVSLARWSAPLFAAGLFGVERSERRAVLDKLPQPLGDTVRRHFERQRALGRAEERVVSGAAQVVQAAHRIGGSLRARVTGALASVAGTAWLDELTVLARGDVEAWTIGDPDEYAVAALSWWQTVGTETAG